MYLPSLSILTAAETNTHFPQNMYCAMVTMFRIVSADVDCVEVTYSVRKTGNPWITIVISGHVLTTVFPIDGGGVQDLFEYLLLLHVSFM
jgi:hypothetical protein